MSKGNSIHAVVAMNALHSASFQNGIIRGSIWDPALGEDHTHPNAHLFGEMEWYLTCREVAHAGDTFNTYCQSILADILEADESVWPLFSNKLFGKNKEETIKKLKQQGKNDGSVRKALREHIKAFWCNEAEIIAELRNKIVHQAGLDPEGKVAEKIKQFPPGKMHIYPVALDPDEFPVDCAPDGKLIIDAKTGYWATQHVLNLIHLMDQNLCARYGLTRSLKPIKKQSYQLSQDNPKRMLLAGTPLPQPLQPEAHQSPNLTATNLPDYEPMATPEEQACATTWQKVSNESDAFVQTTCEEVGVTIREGRGGIAGTPRCDTLEGHDREFFYTLSPSEQTTGQVNHLGIRLRQQDFTPYLTIWSTKTQMKDFRHCELTPEVKAHLTDSIQKTISG